MTGSSRWPRCSSGKDAMPDTLTPALGTPHSGRGTAEPAPALYVALHCDHPTRTPSRHFLADTDGALIEMGHTLCLFRESVARAKGAPLDVDGANLPVPAPGLATFSTPLAA